MGLPLIHTLAKTQYNQISLILQTKAVKDVVSHFVLI